MDAELEHIPKRFQEGAHLSNEVQTRKPYAPDLTDEQWVLLEPMIPLPRTQYGGTPRRVDRREVINTLLYQNRTGCQRELLPHDLLPR
jgi:putative transposase